MPTISQEPVTLLPTLQAVTPDGNGCYAAVAGYFAVISHPPEESSNSYFSVITIHADTGEFAVLTDREDGDAAAGILSPFSWSPDGCRLAVSITEPDPETGSAGFTRVYLMDYNGQNKRLLRPETKETYDFHPAWSPDGRWVAVASSYSLNEIYLVNPDLPSEPRVLISTPRPTGYLSWSPDAKHLAFAQKKKSECSEIFTIDIDSGELTQITHLSHLSSGEPISPCLSAHRPQWSPDGTHIAFLYDFRLHIVDRNGQGLENLTEGIEDLPALDDEIDPEWVLNRVESFSWSPDGQQLVLELWVASNPQIHELYVVNRDGTGLTRIAEDPEMPDQRYPSWGPDGRIVFSAGDGFWLMNSDGSDMHRVGPDLDFWRIGSWWAPLALEP